MPKPRKGRRVLGPYKKRGGYRIIVVDEGGQRTFRSYETEREALQVMRSLTRLMADEEVFSVEEAMKRYESYLLLIKGNKERSVKTTMCRLRSFFGDLSQDIRGFNESKCEELYRAQCANMKVDSHRNTHAEVKTFFNWCMKPKQGWLETNPLEKVEPVGRRRRGKEQLRRDESRKWLEAAVRAAEEGEVGAIAAMCALLLGMRATPIVTRTVRDLDDGGRLLHITNAKTEAGNRVVVVPDLLRPYLLALAEGKRSKDLLFGYHVYGWVSAWTKRLCRRAGVPEVTAHGLRGTHASLAAEVGITGHHVARALGHESEKTTQLHYLRKGAKEAGTQRRTLTLLHCT